MATDAISSLGTSSTGTSSTSTTKNKDTIDAQDFMSLLVAQLKNQDPLNPMDNQQFAVQLAQFSQLEQLVSINGKIGDDKAATGDLSSLASYLGHEVITNSSEVTVKGNNGGEIAFELASDADEVEVQLVDATGNIVERKSLGEMAKGKQVASLTNLTTSSGNYTAQVVATTSGGATTIQAYKAGIVSGVIPGADPKLIVNGEEIGTGDVREVRLPY